jgi:hypothetical protein
MPKCETCGQEVLYPFECNFCGGKFCAKHRLPENHSCIAIPPRTPLGSWQAKKSAISKVELPEISTTERKMFRSRKSKNILKSLKIWLPIFWLTTGLLFFMEKDNPAQFYRGVSEPVKYGLYAFASATGLWSGYGIFKKCDYSPSSDRGIFGLRLLSAGVLIAAIFILMFGIFLMYEEIFLFGGLFIEPQICLARETASFFFIVLSLALIVLSGYLIFKFERRSGVIVYRR